MKTVTSTFLSLNFRDLLKALIIAILTPVIPIIQNSLSAGVLTFDWKNIAIAAAGGAFAYLVKNFLTPSQIVITDADAVTQAKADATK